MNVVIVGCGVAGVTAATVLRQISPDVKVEMYTDEKHPYYPRPELYRILSGETQPAEIYGFSKEWFEDRGIRTQLGKKVVSINPATKELLLDDGTKADYDKLLLANGAHPFMPPAKGVEKTGVFTLRNMEDALKIRDYAKKVGKAIVVGGGLLGLEFAASLRRLGQKVDVVEIFPRLLPNQLDVDGAAVFKRLVERIGINVVLGAKTQEILGEGTVSGIALDDGRELQGGLVLFSAGVRSNIELASEAGIKVNRGVVVDHYLETSAADIYAVGDVAEFEGRVYGIIPAAEEQARTAALNMLDKKIAYAGTIPSNTLKVVGIDLTSIGVVNPEGSKYEEVKRADVEKGIYRKIVLDKGKIVGAIVLGDKRAATAIMKLMELGKDVSQYKEAMLEDNFDFRRALSSP